VTFTIVDGPNSGSTPTVAVTNSDGVATFTYSSSLTGTDTIQAAFLAGNITLTSDPVTVSWGTTAPPPPAPPATPPKADLGVSVLGPANVPLDACARQ
jgi:hypothetical protein